MAASEGERDEFHAFLKFPEDAHFLHAPCTGRALIAEEVLEEVALFNCCIVLADS